ncbi:MAG: hypothetical protein HKN04_10690 [Rhodothermaceae bacterium]|nr:hypothetical protein [Rhodothermaceae bacterium]
MADAWHKTCPRCGGEMTEGILLDYGVSMQARWVDGPLDYGPKWAGGNPKVKRKRAHRVAGYRCVECSFLDFYAQTETDTEANDG